MESPIPISAEKAEPLKLHDSATDDWVKPFGCDHVVVSYSNVKKDKDIVTTKKKKKKGKDSDNELSFCVMCGEIVSEPTEKELTINDLRISRESTLDEDSRLNMSDSRRPVFRRNISSSAVSISKGSTSDTRICLIHSHKKIKYFCEDHQEVCCSVCVNVLHRGCRRVMFIKDEIQNGWDAKVCEETAKTLHLIVQSFDQIISQNQSAQQKLNEQVGNFRSRRQQLRARLLKVIDEFDKASEKQVKAFIKMSENTISSILEKCKEVINDINACSQLLEEALNSSCDKDAFIATHKVLKQKSKYGVALSEAIKQSKDFSIDLIPETQIDNIEDIKQVAKAQFYAEEVTFPESVLASVSKLPMSDLRSPREVLDAFTRSESASSLENPMTFCGKYNVRLADDKHKCENVDAEFLPDDRVAILDMKNKKLKVFDPKFSRASVVDLTSEPRGVAVISPQEVAVTLPDESKIKFVSTGKRLSATRSILTSLPCYGITCHNQELMVLCDDGFSTTAIQVLDFEGKVLKDIKMAKTGKVVLKNPWNIAATLDGQNVCVTDRGRLVCIDFSGRTVFEYVDESLDHARGLTADDLGRFYVCGTGSGNVHQVSPTGKKMAVVLNEKDVTSPQAVCYQSTKRILLLTSVGDDNVYLYKLAKT